MKIIAVDHNRSDLFKLTTAIKAACPNGVLSSFSSMNDALNYVDAYTVQVAFIETTIDGRNGFELAKRLQSGNSWINIIFVTKSDYYAFESYSVHASGYVLKPITPEIVANEFRTLRYPVSDVLATNEKPYLMIKGKSSEIAIPHDEIHCAVYEKHKMQFDVLDMKPLIEKISQAQFEMAVAPLLAEEKFLRVNKTAVVNIEWIDEITNDSFVMCSEREIKIPRKDYAEAKRKYSDFISRYGKRELW